MLQNTLAILWILAAAPADEPRTLRFVGNAGFEISDGSNVFLVDFPYTSGAFGYMSYDPSELHERTGSLCLFTHAHADHFSPGDLAKIGCAVAGPPEVLTRVDAGQRLESGPRWTFGGADVACLRSEHGDVEHCSYLLSWDDGALFIAGDVESVEPLLNRAAHADLWILPYWLSKEATELREHFPEAKIVFSHYKSDLGFELCEGCVRLGQGESLTW